MKPIEIKEEQNKGEIKENELINKNKEILSETIKEEKIEKEEKEEKEEKKIESVNKEERENNKIESQTKSEKLRSTKSKKEPRKKENKKESPKKEISSVKEIEEEISKETKEIEKEAESVLNKHNDKIDIQHKEEFSLEGIKKESTTENSKNENKNKEYTFLPNQQMFYMYNPMAMQQMSNMSNMNNMEGKGQMNQGIYYYPILIDPSKFPKDMQNMGMFYPPMMSPMYPPNFTEQNFKQNTNVNK